MDAYSTYILQTTEARLSELRREAAEHGLSRAARASRASPWARVRKRFGQRSAPAVVRLPLPAPAVDGDAELRRSA